MKAVKKKGYKAMGQRTAFLIKRTYWNGKVNIRLVHHQWGIGRVMHNHFIRNFMEMITDRSHPAKTLKDFMTIIDDEYSLYDEKNYRKNSKRIPDVFAKRVIKRYFSKTDNNNGGMIIDIREKQADKEPYSLKIEDLKIGFVVGDEECNYDYDLDKYIGDKPFERLYTGEEYVRISCNGEYAYPEFISMWIGFINQYGIEEVSDSKQINNDLVA